MAIDGGLAALFHAHLPHFHWQRIESGLTGGGIADDNYCGEGIEGWVEYKQTKAIAVSFRPDQIGWHERRARKGGRTFIAVRQMKRDELYLYRGRDIRQVRLHGIAYDPIMLSYGGPSEWDWKLVENILLSKTK